MESFALSTMGLKRQENQDRYLIKETPGKTLLLAISDGMGSSAGGGVAAQMMMQSLDALPEQDLVSSKVLEKLVLQTDQSIFCKASEKECLEGMGATLTAVIIRGGTGQWVHVGDSRMVAFKNGKLQFITRDQNMAWFLADEGEIPVSEVCGHPGLRALGSVRGMRGLRARVRRPGSQPRRSVHAHHGRSA